MLKSFIQNFKPKLIKIYFFRFFIFCIQFVLYHPKYFRSTTIQKILVVRSKHLGDYILTLPILQALYENFPDACFIISTGIWNRELVEEFSQNIMKVYYYNVKQYCRRKDQVMHWKQKLSILKELSKQNIDLVIDLDGSMGFLWLYLFKRVRFLSTIESLQFIQNLKQLKILKKSKINYNIHTQHELLNLADALRILGLNPIPKTNGIATRPETEHAIDIFFQNKHLTGYFPIIGIHPSASHASKLWPKKQFASLADKLIKKYNAKIIFFGATDDRKRIQSIQSQMMFFSIDGTNLTLSQFIAAIGHCQLIICLDSLAQHVAFLQNIPTVVIYRTNNFKRWSPPNSDNFSIVFNESSISVEDVLNKIPKNFLSKYKKVQTLDGI